VTHQTFVAAYRGFTRRQRFRPFLIEFVSGDRLLVTNREAVWWRGTALIHTSPQNDYRVFDSSSVCQLLDVEPASP